MDRWKAIQEKLKQNKIIAGGLAVAALGLSSLACSASDINDIVGFMTSTEAVPSFTRGAIGTVMCALAFGGLKPVEYALSEDLSAKRALGCLTLAFVIPIAGGVVSVAEPAISYFLFVPPILAGMLHFIRWGHSLVHWEE